MDRYDKSITQRILKSLETNEIGLTICEAAELAGTTRITARKHLDRLMRDGVVEQYVIGRCKVNRKKRANALSQRYSTNEDDGDE